MRALAGINMMHAEHVVDHILVRYAYSLSLRTLKKAGLTTGSTSLTF
jgi:hypothetical protein